MLVRDEFDKSIKKKDVNISSNPYNICQNINHILVETKHNLDMKKKFSMFCIDNYTKPVFKINAKIPLFLYW